MDIRGYIGIDFGTANSHFAYCEKEVLAAKPIPLSAAEGKSSVPSFLLWEINANHRRIPKTWGQLAIEEWVLDDDDTSQSGRYLLTGAFKPDLAISPMSRDAAREFMGFARQEMVSTRTPPGLHEQPGWQVIIGVPAEVGDAHRNYTEAAAREAGFEQVICLEEPLGAVGYYLAGTQLTDRDLDAGVLVVDFGGGTLDLSTVDRGGVKEPWGDPNLGGRLFDDLFFQWVVDSSQVNLSDFSKTELFGIWWLHCRGLKENFSRHWSRKQTDDFCDFKGRIPTRDGGNFGALRGVGLSEFLERARQYQPSALARDYFQAIDSPLKNLGESKPVDLLNWVRETLSRGPARRYGTIILTGGSSSWPFIVPMVREVFGDAEILIPNNPDCTIGEGLALWHVLHRKYQNQQKKALADVPALQRALDEVVVDTTQRAGIDIAKEIAGQIMSIARPKFQQWHQQGGRLADVERDVAAACRLIPVKSIIDNRLSQLLPEVEVAASNAMRQWLLQQGVQLGDWTGLRLSGAVGSQKLSLTVSIADDLATTALEKAVSYITFAIIGGLMLVIAATEVTLLASPLALLALPIAGGLWMARDYVKEKLLTFEFEGDVLGWLHKLYGTEKLENALSKGDEECRKAITDVIEVALKDVRVQLEALIAAARDEVLRRYGLLDKLSRLPTG
jgi:molecular chaperone DnaK